MYVDHTLTHTHACFDTRVERTHVKSSTTFDFAVDYEADVTGDDKSCHLIQTAEQKKLPSSCLHHHDAGLAGMQAANTKCIW